MARRLPHGARLVLASHNPGKVREIEDLLRPYGIAVLSAGALGLPEPEEDAPDFVGNARIKALAAARASGLPALSDDSGFCVAALDGAPGVFSARWAGLGKDFAPAMVRVHQELGDTADRRAWFMCALCLGWPEGQTETFLGRVDGTVVWPPRGEHGFGYDPIFVPAGESRTFGEIEPEQKHAVSHRARAFAQLVARLPSAPRSGASRGEVGDTTASPKFPPSHPDPLRIARAAFPRLRSAVESTAGERQACRSKSNTAAVEATNRVHVRRGR